MIHTDLSTEYTNVGGERSSHFSFPCSSRVWSPRRCRCTKIAQLNSTKRGTPGGSSSRGGHFLSILKDPRRVRLRTAYGGLGVCGTMADEEKKYVKKKVRGGSTSTARRPVFFVPVFFFSFLLCTLLPPLQPARFASSHTTRRKQAVWRAARLVLRYIHQPKCCQTCAD